MRVLLFFSLLLSICSCGVFKKKTFECPPVDTTINVVDTVFIAGDTILLDIPCDIIDTIEVGDTLYYPVENGKTIRYWKTEAGRLKALLDIPPKEVIVERVIPLKIQPKPSPCKEVALKNFAMKDKFMWWSGLVAWIFAILSIIYTRLTTSR